MLAEAEALFKDAKATDRRSSDRLVSVASRADGFAMVALAKGDLEDAQRLLLTEIHALDVLAAAADRTAVMFTPTVEPLGEGFTLSLPDRLRPVLAERRR